MLNYARKDLSIDLVVLEVKRDSNFDSTQCKEDIEKIVRAMTINLARIVSSPKTFDNSKLKTFGIFFSQSDYQIFEGRVAETNAISIFGIARGKSWGLGGFRPIHA